LAAGAGHALPELAAGPAGGGAQAGGVRDRGGHAGPGLHLGFRLGSATRMRDVTAAGPAPSRLAYLDGVRGLVIVVMVLNHTARWWMDGHMTWPRYHLIWITLTVAAPTFLFLVGFCLPLSLRGAPESLGALARKFVPRGVRIIVYGLLLNLLVLRDEPILAGGVLQTIGLAIIVMTPALWLLR